ncbi:hypothetical protein IAT40_004383 [Kwoniella sp. CBS 6097]
MSANPPIRGIAIQSSASPSLLIDRYFSSLPQQFSPAPDIPSPPAPSSRLEKPQPSPQVDEECNPHAPTPLATDHPSQLRTSHPPPSAQKKRQKESIRVHLEGLSRHHPKVIDRGADPEADHTERHNVPERQNVPGPSNRSRKSADRNDEVDHQRHRRDTAKMQEETAPAKNARKIRRREKAAITKPKPPPPPPSPHPRNRVTTKRQRKVDEIEHHDGSAVESEQSRSMLRTAVRRKRSRKFDATDIIRKYNPVNILTDGGRLTLGPKEGFFALGRSSEPIKLPEPRDVRMSKKGPHQEQHHRTHRAGFLQTRSRRRPVGSNHRTTPEQSPRLQLERYRYRPDQPQHNSIPDQSYSRLPAPGLTTSTSWPTWSSNHQHSIPSLRSSRGAARGMERPMEVRDEGVLHQDRMEYQRGGEEVDSIVGRGAWKWPPHHPIAQALKNNEFPHRLGYVNQGFGPGPSWKSHQHVHPRQENYDTPGQRIDSMFPPTAHNAPQHLYAVAPPRYPGQVPAFGSYHYPQPAPYVYEQPAQHTLPYPSSSVSGFSKQLPFDRSDLGNDQPFFENEPISSQDPHAQRRQATVKSSSSDKRWEHNSFGTEKPIQPRYLGHTEKVGGPETVIHDGGSVFGIPPESALIKGPSNQNDYNDYGTPRDSEIKSSDSLGLVISLSQLATYRTPPQVTQAQQQRSSQRTKTISRDDGFGNSF